MNRRALLQSVLLAGLYGSLRPLAARDMPPLWLYVDTHARSVTLFEGYRDPKPLRYYSPGALGRNGAADYRLRGSRVTPKGRFRISGINEQSRFHRFFSWNYPTVEQAWQGLKQGDISPEEQQAVLAAHRREQAPPQHTALGGHIGLHGVSGQRRTDWDWTDGCVALTNKQIDALTPWIGVGTDVIVV